MEQKKVNRSSVLKRMRDGGQVLCFSFGTEGAPHWWLHPSECYVGRAAAHRAIESGELVSSRDGLFEGVTQTWRLREADLG
jgi:hypothetical protein